MTKTIDTVGMKMDGIKMARTNITVRMTKDKMGMSISLCDDKVMLLVPIEPIKKELKEMLNA